MTSRVDEPRVVVGIGEVLWDMFPTGRQLGGAPANCVIHAQAMGASAWLVSAVGRDALGNEILRHLALRGVDTSCIAVDPLHPTGRVTVRVGKGGEPQFAIEQEVAWDYIPATQRATNLVARAAAVCYGTLAQRAPTSRATIRMCLDAAAPACLRVFDANLRHPFIDRDCMSETLARSDVVKLNEDELRRIADWFALGTSENEILDNLLERYRLRLVAVTKGARGSRLYGRDGDSVHSGYPVKVVTTVGAGDSFTAALMMGLLDGRPLEEINDTANRIASLVCTQSGACPPLAESQTGHRQERNAT